MQTKRTLDSRPFVAEEGQREKEVRDEEGEEPTEKRDPRYKLVVEAILVGEVGNKLLCNMKRRRIVSFGK